MKLFSVYNKYHLNLIVWLVLYLLWVQFVEGNHLGTLPSQSSCLALREETGPFPFFC